MNSNRHPSAYGYKPPVYGHAYGAYAPQPPRERVPDELLHAKSLEIERKYFNLTLRENARGRFLRITEARANHHQCIVIPASGLKEFQRVLEEILKDEPQTPPTPPAA